MKKNIIITVLSFIVLASCTKDAEMNMAQEKTFVPEKNMYRATQIEGKNPHWGDYTLKMEYKNEKLESCVRLDNEGDTVGRIRISRISDIKYSFYIEDYVPSIDADSIQRLDDRLKKTYGANNYSLKDSIPKSAQTLLNMVVDLYRDGRVVRQTAIYYVPRENNGVGDDFDYTYLKNYKITDVYEYDEEGRICACREFYDVFDRKDAEIYTRSLYKDEYVYNKKYLTDILLMEAESGDSFKSYDRYVIQRTGDSIEDITGEHGVKRHFVWTNGTLSSIQDEKGNICTYAWDGNGNVTEINEGNGNVMRVTYEAGNGNFSWLSPLRDYLYGNPYIK